MMQYAIEEVQVVATENPRKDVRILTNLSNYWVIVGSQYDWLRVSPLYKFIM